MPQFVHLVFELASPLVVHELGRPFVAFQVSLELLQTPINHTPTQARPVSTKAGEGTPKHTQTQRHVPRELCRSPSLPERALIPFLSRPAPLAVLPLLPEPCSRPVRQRVLLTTSRRVPKPPARHNTVPPARTHPPTPTPTCSRSTHLRHSLFHFLRQRRCTHSGLPRPAHLSVGALTQHAGFSSRRFHELVRHHRVVVEPVHQVVPILQEFHEPLSQRPYIHELHKRGICMELQTNKQTNKQTRKSSDGE